MKPEGLNEFGDVGYLTVACRMGSIPVHITRIVALATLGCVKVGATIPIPLTASVKAYFVDKSSAYSTIMAEMGVIPYRRQSIYLLRGTPESALKTRRRSF